MYQILATGSNWVAENKFYLSFFAKKGDSFYAISKYETILEHSVYIILRDLSTLFMYEFIHTL